MEFLEQLADFQRQGTGGIQRELCEFLRRKIESNILPPGLKLPSLRQLAKLWCTNFFSVKLATDELVELGFLTKQQGRGMFVAPQKKKIQSIGVYSSLIVEDYSQGSAFRLIQEMVCRRLCKLGFSYVIWNDYRPEAEHTGPPEEMTRAIISGNVQSVIGIVTRYCDKNWFFNLPLKKVSMMANRFPKDNYDHIVRQLLARKCRRVAAIVPENEPGYSFLIDTLKHAGIHFMPQRLKLLTEKDYMGKDYSEVGYHFAKKFLSSSPRPDALITYPDNMVPGILYAVYESGMKVPDDLLLVLHRNSEMRYFCPFPALYIDTNLSEMTNRLVTAATGIPEQSEGRTIIARKLPGNAADVYSRFDAVSDNC